MKNFDSLTLKFFYEENKDFLNGGVIQKIQMPTRTEILFYIRSCGQNKKLYVNINPKYPHLCFIEDKADYLIKIPNKPPMFCMQLRKYLEGAKIKNANLVPYDRIIEFYFSVIDEFGLENNLILSIELMGKYSNVILYDEKTKIITGSCHNVSSDKSREREVYGGIKYIYPKKQDKKDILKISYSTFLQSNDDIPNNYFYFTKPYFDFLDDKSFEGLQHAVFDPDYLKEFWGSKNKTFNEIIFNYYSKIVNNDRTDSKKRALEKTVNLKLKGLDAILNEKIDTEKFERYKKSGDLIFQYIYLLKGGEKSVEFDGFTISLDENLSPADNAQKYYRLYSKIKAAKAVLEKRQNEATVKKEYLRGVLFSIQNADNINVLDEIEEEITPNKTDKPKKPEFTPINFMGFEIYLGKNNKQNDYLIKKMSDGEDIWLHAFNCPSSHVIIKTQNGKKIPSNEVLLYAAKLVKENSPLKNNAKASIIYTKRKFLKRPPDTHAGYVTYREEKEIVV